MEKTEEKSKLKFILGVCLKAFILLLGVTIIGFSIPYLAHTGSGGELKSRDFRGGFDLYVEESRVTWFPLDLYEEAPHSSWRVTDEGVKDEIYELCAKIDFFRERSPVYDILLGSGDYKMEHLPVIYFDVGGYGYCIYIINWDNYAGSQWNGWPILRERYGAPTFEIYRYSLENRAEGEDFFSFMNAQGGRDSQNREGGSGWYSTSSQERLDGLLDLLYSIGEGNAEHCITYP